MADPIIDEAVQLIEGARKGGVVVRLVGSLGVRLHCADTGQLHDELGRRVKDIDVVCRKKDRNALRDFFERRGYEIDRDLLIAMEGTRYVFRHPQREVEIDVFVDDLDFNHLVPLKGRLERHALTIPLEELVLHKLQVVRPTTGDYKDLFALFSIHDIGSGDDPEVIEASHIAAVLARDWGFHHTAVANLERLRAAMGESSSKLGVPSVSDAVREKVERRIDALQGAIADQPKSVRWKARAKVGERMQWWQDVDDPRDTY